MSCISTEQSDNSSSDEEDMEDELKIPSTEDQLDSNKCFYIHENKADFGLFQSQIYIKNIDQLDFAEFKLDDVKKLQYPCLGKTHVKFTQGLHFNDTAMRLLRKEKYEDGFIFGDVILFNDVSDSKAKPSKTKLITDFFPGKKKQKIRIDRNLKLKKKTLT